MLNSRLHLSLPSFIVIDVNIRPRRTAPPGSQDGPQFSGTQRIYATLHRLYEDPHQSHRAATQTRCFH